jgi:DNA mismatch repair protein MSH6
MARGIEGNEIATPRVPKLQKSASSASQPAKQQKSILGFFQRKTAPASSPVAPSDTAAAAAASSPPPQSSPAPANFNGKENGVLLHNLITLLNR